jgi:hypothetical protein
MKKNLMALCLGLVLSLPASAASVMIGQVDRSLSVTGLTYQVNAEMGRAWVYVNTHDANAIGGDGQDADGSSREMVPGLAYDAAKMQIVFAQDGASVVCATVSQRRGFFGGSRLVIVPTGLCGFHVEASTVTRDDGFDPIRYSVWNVFFDAN